MAGHWRSLHLVSENPIDLFYPLKNSPVVKKQTRQSRSRYTPSFLIQSKFNEPPGNHCDPHLVAPKSQICPDAAGLPNLKEPSSRSNNQSAQLRWQSSSRPREK